MLDLLSAKTELHARATQEGVAPLTDVTPGIYAASVAVQGRKVADTIINVTGRNSVIALTIDTDTQSINPVLKSDGALLERLAASPCCPLVSQPSAFSSV